MGSISPYYWSKEVMILINFMQNDLGKLLHGGFTP